MNHMRTVMKPGTGRVAVIYDNEQLQMCMVKFYTIGQRPEPRLLDVARAILIAEMWVNTGHCEAVPIPQPAVRRSVHGNWGAVL